MRTPRCAGFPEVLFQSVFVQGNPEQIVIPAKAGIQFVVIPLITRIQFPDFPGFPPARE
jgi:hypothetical protein